MRWLQPILRVLRVVDSSDDNVASPKPQVQVPQTWLASNERQATRHRRAAAKPKPAPWPCWLGARAHGLADVRTAGPCKVGGLDIIEIDEAQFVNTSQGKTLGSVVRARAATHQRYAGIIKNFAVISSQRSRSKYSLLMTLLYKAHVVHLAPHNGVMP